MIRHDFHCDKCGEWTEVTFATVADVSDKMRREIDCVCGGRARHVWRTGPGLAGVEEPGTRGLIRTFQPGRDVQLGKHFNSRAERDRYVAGRGLVTLGPDEYNATMAHVPSDPEPDFSGLRPAMKEAYEELKAGKPAPPVTQVDAGQFEVIKE